MLIMLVDALHAARFEPENGAGVHQFLLMSPRLSSTR